MKISFDGLSVEVPQLDTVVAKLKTIELVGEKIMGKLEDLKTKMVELKTQIAALNTALDDTRVVMDKMKVDLAALRSGEVLSDEVNTKIDGIIAGADAALAEIKATYDENFPGAQPPPVEPPPDEV